MTLRPTRQTPATQDRTTPLLWGVILLVGGVVLLLQSLSVLEDSPWVWALVLGLAGVALLAVFATRPEAWWTAIPAGVVLGLAAVTLIEDVGPSGAAGDAFTGAAFLGLMGLGFLAVFARDRHHWWALIPGGVMVSLSGLVLAEHWLGDEASVAIMFLGFALTFLALSAIHIEGRRRRWPLVPAGALGLLALLFAVGEEEALRALDYVYPVAAIVVGAWLVWRFAGHNRPRMR